ncbi:MAG: ribonuclease H-like domain-containing protein [Acidobacteriota bacterium]|nr:ribonuclease H-like domain-containing protein [Acidobacteriota bacterium]
MEPSNPRTLSSRLRAIVRSNPPARELTFEPDVPEKRGVLPPPPDLSSVAEALGGRPLENQYGSVLTVDRRYEADRWHGDEQIGNCELEDFEALRTLDPRFRTSWRPGSAEPADGREPEAESRSPLFFDLETTGLSGGAGTVAFLVGCAWFDCGALQVRQFVLTSLAAERALLEALRAQMASAPFMASYNGRTFDAPLMDVRWAFHRLPSPFDTKPHFDMLPPARRLWKHRGERPGGALERFGNGDGTPRQVDTRSGCSLMAFERQLLGFRRVGDVPGFEIPSRYFHFLRTGDASGLEMVLEHNRLDLVSLAVLTARAARIVRGGHGACADARESLALGRIYEQTGRLADARACYERAAETGDRATRADALSRLAISLRKERRHEDAAAVWRRIVDARPPRTRTLLPLERLAMEALAVHHEHREKDLELAKKFAEALNDENGDEGIRRRLSRLERKMSERQSPLLN